MSEAQDRKLAEVEVVSMGCRLNGYEAEKMAGLANSAGLSDTTIINSCAVTNEAVRQTRQKIRQISREKPEQRIVVTGCAAQVEADMISSMPEVDVVLGNAEKLKASSWGQIKSSGTVGSVSDIMSVTSFAAEELSHPNVKQRRTRAFVQVQNGCDHRCTFCIIPFGRGNSRSVPIDHVVQEVRELVDIGTPEVVLTGVDMTSYGHDLGGRVTLGLLVHEIVKTVPDLPQLRLSSVDSIEIDDQLFRLITEHPGVAPHLHLSLQSGDNMILKRMKRRHSREDAIELCNRIREVRPEVVFGADIIAGFPTETEEMFENSLRLVEDCQLTYLHVFPFSSRQGTPAAKMPQNDRAVIKQRAARLRAAGDLSLANTLDALTGQTQSVLIEKIESGAQGQLEGRGRLANFAEVRFTVCNSRTNIAAGDFVEMALINHDGRILTGMPLEETLGE